MTHTWFTLCLPYFNDRNIFFEPFVEKNRKIIQVSLKSELASWQKFFFVYFLVKLSNDQLVYTNFGWNKADLRKYITFKTAVRNVTYNKDSDTFGVVIEDFDKKTLLPIQTFDYVIVAIGHYSVPFTPYYPGVERFPGRVMHSHDFRDACEFAGKRLLVVRFFSFLTAIFTWCTLKEKKKICKCPNDLIYFAEFRILPPFSTGNKTIANFAKKLPKQVGNELLACFKHIFCRTNHGLCHSRQIVIA